MSTVRGVPRIRAVGTVASGPGTIAPGLPVATAVGDLLLMFVENSGEAAASASGWTEEASQLATGVGLTVLSRVATGSDPTTVDDVGDHQLGRIIGIIAGTYDSSQPIHVVAKSTQASTTAVSIPGFATTVQQCLVLAGTGGDLPDTDSTTEFSSWANADLHPASPVYDTAQERIDNTTSAGNGGALGVLSGIFGKAGTLGATTVTAATAAVRANIAMAVQAPAATFTNVVPVHSWADHTDKVFGSYVTNTVEWPGGLTDALILALISNNKASGDPTDGVSLTGCGLTWSLLVAGQNDPESLNRQIVYYAQGSPSDGALTWALTDNVSSGWFIHVVAFKAVPVGNGGLDAIVQHKKGSQDNREANPKSFTFDISFDAAPLNSLPQALGHTSTVDDQTHAGIIVEVGGAAYSAVLSWTIDAGVLLQPRPSTHDVFSNQRTEPGKELLAHVKEATADEGEGWGVLLA